MPGAGQITGAPSQKFSGIIDLRGLQELEARIVAITEGITPGPWTKMTVISAKIKSSGVEARLEGYEGSIVRMRSNFLIGAESIPPNTHLFTLPVGLRPIPGVRAVAININAGTPLQVTILENGEVSNGPELPKETFVEFSTITFSTT